MGFLSVSIFSVQTQGILIGFDNLDRVIHIIREASSNSIATAGLRNGKLHILNLFIDFPLYKNIFLKYVFQDM